MVISDEVVRQRSYEIWQRQGCPQGKALQHWFQAKLELESESRLVRFTAIAGDYREVVSARPSISYPPRKLVARKVPGLDRTHAA